MRDVIVTCDLLFSIWHRASLAQVRLQLPSNPNVTISGDNRHTNLLHIKVLLNTADRCARLCTGFVSRFPNASLNA